MLLLHFFYFKPLQYGAFFFFIIFFFYLFLRHWQEEIQHPSPSQGALFPSNSPLRRSLRLLLPIGKNIRQQTRFVLASHRIILISSLPFANFLIFRYIVFLKSFHVQYFSYTNTNIVNFKSLSINIINILTHTL